jgi:hypothetical protein
MATSRHVQRSATAAVRALPTLASPLAWPCEVAQREIEADRVAGVQGVPRTLEHEQPPARFRSERLADRRRRDPVIAADGDQDRAAQLCAQLRGAVRYDLTADRRRQRLGRGLEAPRDGVFDLLGRVRFNEDLAEEELHEAGKVALPAAAAEAIPAFVGLARLVEAHDALDGGREHRPEEGACSHEADPGHPLRMLCGEEQSAVATERQADEQGALRAGRIHDFERVGRELRLVVGRGLERPIGAAVAARIKGNDARVAREVGDLRLPYPRVDDRPRR